MKNVALDSIVDPSQPIYALSPHIDDVIWSIGGPLQSLAERGYEIVLVSIFSQTIYVYDQVRQPVEATLIRKGEDYTAARAAGFKNVIFLDFPDGILRDTPQGQVINSDYQTPAYLLKIISDCLAQTIPENATVLAPAAFGGHMDHLTTRRAALSLPQTKLLYRDLPYGVRDKGNAEALAFLKNGWKNVQLSADAKTRERHLELFWHYRSQTSQEVADELSAYLAKNGFDLWLAG